MSEISNFEIERVINELDDDLKANYVGTFASNHTFRFLNFTEVISEKDAPYPFMVMNRDRSNQKGTHWWSFLELSAKEYIFLFDTYGFISLKEFIIDNDRKLIDKFFYGLEKINKKDKKINLTYVQFMVDDCFQDLESDTYGLFQLYFYVNLFLPEQNSKILNNKNLPINTSQTLLNEIFALDINENKRRVESFGQESNIKRD